MIDVIFSIPLEWLILLIPLLIIAYVYFRKWRRSEGKAEAKAVASG